MSARRHVAGSGVSRRIGASLAALVFVVAWSVIAGGSSASAGTEAHAKTHSGEHIVWSQFVDLNFSAARIVISRVGGLNAHALTHPAHGVVDIDPKISPNGRLVAFERDDPQGNGHIMVVGIRGRGAHEVEVGCVDPCFSANNPTWTPDGRHLLFQKAIGPIDSNGNAASALLWKTDLHGKHVVLVSNPALAGAYEDYDAQFAAAGYVVFGRLNLRRDQAAIFRMRADGSHACRLTPWALNADLPDASPAASGPTQNLAVFESHGHGGPPPGKAQAIATTPARCGGRHPVSYLTSPTSAPVQHFNPSWSPDGKHVVFVRFKFVNGDPIVHGDIMTSRWDGTGRHRITHSKLFDFRPDWGPAPDQ
jgi:TolB protein